MTASGAALRTVLVMGATGYIGSHAVRALAAAGFSVRAAARTPARLAPSVRQSAAEVVAADVTNFDSLRAALTDIDTAFYLVHTLGSGPDYAERDRQAAIRFGEAARACGVRRIVYLGGLGQTSQDLSEHLASRQEVGRILADSGVPVIEFRASIVLGSGSTSFEMIRNLVEKLPAMTTPRWVRMNAQPIAVEDVERYFVAAARATMPPTERHRIYEIGGADIISYSELMRLYAHARGLHRLIIPVPVLSPGLSGWWLYLFTPREATVGRQLAESLRFPTVVTDDRAQRDFPDVHPIGVADAMRHAFESENEAFMATSWAVEFAGMPSPVHAYREGRFLDSRTILAACPPEAAFDPVACIGGEKGWYAFDTLWDIRGFIDLLLGGPGRRRGRRDPYALIEGDHLEWWRVERIRAPRELLLRAEMRMPGEGWLHYELMPVEGGTLVRQTAVYEPKGVLGRLYWYLVLPFHAFVFEGTLKGIDHECSELANGPATCPLPGAWERESKERAPVARRKRRARRR